MFWGEATHPAITLATASLADRTATGGVYPTSGLQQFGFAINFFFPALALLVVGLRVYSRFQSKNFGMDDALILVAMLLSVGETVATYMFMKTNFIGIHAWDVPADYDTRTAGIWNFLVQVFYNPILALVKTSMLLFLLKLGKQKPGVRWSIYALNTFNLALMVAIFLVVLFQCHPIAYNWDNYMQGDQCIRQGAFYVSTAGLTIFTDILTLAIPFWIFLDLKMRLRVKVALLFIFLLGGIVTVVGSVRLWYIYTSFFKPPSADPTYSLGFCTSIIETNLAIICASAPSLRGLIRSWFPRFFSSGRPSGTPYYENRYRLGDDSNTPGGRSDGFGGHAFGRSKNKGRSSKNPSAARSVGAAGASVSSGSYALNDLKGSGSGAGSGSGVSGVSGTGPSSGLGHNTMTAVGSASPTASEEEIMAYHGIIRTTDVTVHYDEDADADAHKDSLSTRRPSHRRRSSSIGATHAPSVSETV